MGKLIRFPREKTSAYAKLGRPRIEMLDVVASFKRVMEKHYQGLSTPDHKSYEALTALSDSETER